MPEIELEQSRSRGPIDGPAAVPRAPVPLNRTWIALGILAPVGMLAVSGLMLLDLRQDAWDKAQQTSKNLLQVLERDIARNIELYDLSVHAAADNLNAPGVTQLTPDLRQLVLFDRAATARDMDTRVGEAMIRRNLVSAEASTPACARSTLFG